MNDNEKVMYSIGYKDAVAGVLADTKDKFKLPEQAKWYEESFKEKHFSHEWHTN